MRIGMPKTITAVAVCLLTLVPQSCRTQADVKPLGRAAAVSSYSAFGIELYRNLAASQPQKNLFVSPASIGFALAMTYNGAAGETRDAMAGTLRLPTKEPAAVNSADSALIAGMNAPIEGVELSVANSLWGRKGVAFKKDFLARNERYYGAEIRSLDFTSAETPGTINAWVAEKTRDKITGIVDRIDPSSILYLINAIYFKGAWTNEFDKELTRDAPFHLAGGGEKRVPMMSRSDGFLYLRGDGFQAARLPYGDGRVGMYVFLPDEGSSLEKFHAALTPESWKTWMQGFVKREGRVALPRFKMEYERKLKRPLSELGMAVAFDPVRANFTDMLQIEGANAYIFEVIHKTFCEVNEEGTEAAAVTSVEMRLTSTMEPRERFEMVCDRPFFFAIVDGETGLVLFMGSLSNPG